MNKIDELTTELNEKFDDCCSLQGDLNAAKRLLRRWQKSQWKDFLQEKLELKQDTDKFLGDCE